MAWLDADFPVMPDVLAVDFDSDAVIEAYDEWDPAVDEPAEPVRPCRAA